jgi:hypothetical protein
LASRHRVSCIVHRQHPSPHERVHSIGGVNTVGAPWKLVEPDAIRTIESGQYAFFVIVGGREVEVVVATHLGRKYLKTATDGYEPNHLLDLPECGGASR